MTLGGSRERQARGGRTRGALDAIDRPLALASDTPAGGAQAVSRAPRVRAQRAGLVLLVLCAAIVGIALWSATVGQFPVTADEIVQSIGRRLAGKPIVPQTNGGIGALSPAELRAVQVDGSLWNIRIPRIVLGLIVGACLGVAGCLTQAVFANPLAEPGIIGTSAGAAVGACLVIVFGLGASAGASGGFAFAQPLGAFIGGIVTTALVYAMAVSRSRTRVLTIVLTGIAVNAVANAIIALLMFLATRQSRDEIVFWQLGSLNGAMWSAVMMTLPMLCIGLVVSGCIARPLDLLALGERTARHLGVRVELLRVVSVITLALLSAAAVAFAGMIAFVGLIVPHLFRLVLGPSNRTLIPASALGGAALIAIADLGARTLVPFADLPIGMFTALIGGPVFYVLLRRQTKRGGGAGE